MRIATYLTRMRTRHRRNTQAALFNRLDAAKLGGHPPTRHNSHYRDKGDRKMIIETPRLRLRPYAETDLRDALAVLGDPETMSFYPSPYSENEVAAAIRSSIETYRLHGYGRFAVIEKASSDYVGDCGITIQDIDGTKEHEVGYRIGKAKWGRGYAHEAAAAVVQYGFETLTLSRLCSYMASDHLQSRRVAEKIGMVLEKQYRNPRNRDYLTCVYAIHRAETSTTPPGRLPG